MTDLAKVREALAEHFKADRDRLVADLNWAIVEIERLRQALQEVANNDTSDLDILATCPNDKNLQEWIALRALNSCKYRPPHEA